MESAKQHTLLVFHRLVVAMVLFGLLFGLCLPKTSQGSSAEAKVWIETPSNTGHGVQGPSVCFFKSQKVLTQHFHFVPRTRSISSDYFSNIHLRHKASLPKVTPIIAVPVKNRISFTCQLLI